MGLLSRKFGFWTRCAAFASALLALAPAVAAAVPGTAKPPHGHRSAGKRAVLAAKPQAEPARAGKAAGAKDAPKDAPKVVGAKDAPKAAAKREAAVPSSSVGSPNEGKLVGGVKLDTSDGTVRVVPAYTRGDSRWGLPAMIHMLERAAKKVAKKSPGSVLGVGDISHRHGGDIFLHRSHESGRDADLAFYVLDHRGKNLLPDTFVQFQGSVESTSMPGARFDVPRNWALVQAMLEDPIARVSHIFVADPLRRMLLAHAKPRVLPALYNRAAAVMMQPSNALPHDNHFHVRISCPPAMRKSCVEYPIGVKFSKAGKGKPALMTPHAKRAQGEAIAARKPAPAPRAATQAHTSVARPAARPAAKAAAKPLAAPKPAPVRRELASAETPKKKPIYLQSAVANSDDPLDSVLFSVPALSHLGGNEPSEGDADSTDVKASLDESGTVKITD